MGGIVNLLTLPSASRERQEIDLATRETQIISDDAVASIEAAGLTAAQEIEALGSLTDATVLAALENAALLKKDEEIVIENASINVARLERQNRREAASEYVGIASSGFTTTGFADLIAANESERAQDALMIRRGKNIQVLNLAKQREMLMRETGEAVDAATLQTQFIRENLETKTSAISRSANVRSQTAILSGRSRARAAKDARRNQLLGGIADTATSFLPGGQLNRFAKVII